MKTKPVENFPDPSGLANSTDLRTIDEKGRPPKSRLKDAKSAHELFTKLQEADRPSAHNRKLVQGMYDGEPPHDPQQLKALGQTHRFNLNFGEAAAQLETALTSYIDLANSVPTLIRVSLPVDYLTPTERSEKEQIIAEEHYRMLRGWGRFDTNQMLLATQFVGHGVGITYFENDRDWRYQVSGLGDFIFPRGTRACEEDIEVAFCTRKYQSHQLYEPISDPAAAAKVGWNVDAVIDAILYSVHKDKASENRLAKWEEYQSEVKNNDLHLGVAKSDTISVNHCWVKEFDGKVSHYMLDASGSGKDFLYQNRNRFESVKQAFVVFTFGVGNGFYHGIRGQGFKILPHVQTSNRLRNAALDATFMGLTLMVQPESASDLATMSMVNLGPLTAMPPGLRVLERQFENKASEALPVLNDLSVQMQNNTGAYRPTPVDATVVGRDRVTRAEILNRAQAQGTLSISAFNLFYQPWERLQREVFRRIQRKGYSASDPGGVEVMEFRKRCEQRGVTVDDIAAVQDVMAVRAVGSGSAQVRALAFDELMQYAGALDPIGRNNLLRDKFAEGVGQSMVDRYLPRLEQSRATLDEQFAELENSDLRMGTQVAVTPGQEPLVHAQVHLRAMQETAQALVEGATDPQTAFTHLAVAIPHTKAHLEAFAGDPTRQDVYAQLATDVNILENLGKQLHNNLQETAHAQATLQQGAEGGAAPSMTPEMEIKMREHDTRMQLLIQEHTLRMQQKAELAQQQLAINDMKTAQKISSGA